MAIHTFGAIDVGSYELNLKIFEISRGKGIREVDDLVRRVDLGTDTYTHGKISSNHVREVTQILQEFHRIMDTYRVEAYQAYGTSAIREMTNAEIVLSQWEQKSGIHIDVLSNSEQRFLDYKSVAMRGEKFNKSIQDTCAIVDIGGSSIQISLFEKDKLAATQNMKLGVLRIREMLSHIDVRTGEYERLISDLVNSQMEVFRKLYLHNDRIHNIIIVDDYISALMQARHMDIIHHADFDSFAAESGRVSVIQLARKAGITEDAAGLLHISAVVMGCIVDSLGAELIYAPGVTLADGIAYEYAEKKKIILPEHDFEEDIIACAKNISRRYMGSEERSRSIEDIALKIFDATKKAHGMGMRERFLLRMASILHDCGKYISMVNLATCSYDIIMSTEIIGLSHIEREIVANVVKYNHSDFVYYEEQEGTSDLTREAYLTIARLTAILRLSNGIDRTHQQKFSDLHVRTKDDRLLIFVPSGIDVTLEKGMFRNRADFFEEVMGIRPVIRQGAVSRK